MNQLALTMPPARAEGMRAALENAGDDWRNEAYTFLIAYARKHEVVCGEDVSDAHIAAGLPQPKDLRSWGGLYKHAQTERVLAFLDNEGRSRRRASPARRYRSLVWSGS